MALVVQKYGGSSVADAEKIQHVARRIMARHTAGDRVVAVVSAMGKTTDELIALTAQITSNPRPRELDMLMATGEAVSSTLLSMALHELGAEAISLSGPQAGIRTDAVFGRARISGIDTARLEHELDRGQIVIVAGFQGASDDFDITTLGRGGSDTTAVALAAALNADRCEIYSDVAGIYTADPRVCPAARPLRDIGYEEMLELAATGARVIHARAVEIGELYGVRDPRREHVRHRGARYADPQGDDDGAGQQGARDRARVEHREDHGARRTGPAGRRGAPLRPPRRGRCVRRHHRAERQRRAAHRHDVHRRPRRA